MSDTNPPNPSKPPRRARTREEIQTEYSALGRPSPLSEKEKEAKAQRAAELRQQAINKTAEKAASDIAGLGVSLQKSLSTVQEELTKSLAELGTVQELVKVETEELTRLHGVETVQAHLDVLQAQHDEKRQALESNVVMLQQAWEQEKRDILKAREREAVEYKYQLDQERKIERDRFNEDMRIARHNEKLRTEEFDKKLAEHQKVVAAAEQELQELRTLKTNLPVELEKAEKKGAAIATGNLSKDFVHEKQLLERDRMSEKSLYEADKRGYVEQVGRLTKLNEELQVALTEANKKNVEIATKALEASSDKAALAAVQNFAKDQNNGSTKRS